MPTRDFIIEFRADTTHATAGMSQLQLQLGIMFGSLNGNTPQLAALNQQLANMGQHARQAAPELASAGSAARAMATDMMSMGGGFLLLQGAAAILQNFGEQANKAREHTKELADQSLVLLNAMREIASLKGTIGPDNALAAGVHDLAVKAGYTKPEDAIKFMEQFEGSSPAGVQKGNIAPNVKDDLMVEGARFGQRMKLDPKTAGDLTGVLSQYQKIGSVTEGAAMLGRIGQGLNEGRGNLEPLVRSLLNTAGAVVGGPVEDLGELAAIQGVASTHANPRESGTRTRQAVRALRSQTGDTAMFLRRTAKIVDTDTHMQRLGKVKAQVDIARANGIDADTYLSRVGFDKNDDERRAVLEQINDFDIIQQRIASGKKIQGRQVIETDRRFQAETLPGQKGVIDARKNQSQFLVGTHHQRFQMARENAESQMLDPKTGELGGWQNRVMDFMNDLGGLIPLAGGVSSRDQRINDKALNNARAEATRLGIPVETHHVQDVAKHTLGYLPSLLGIHPMEGFTQGGKNAEFNRLADKIQLQPGGNTYGPGPNNNAQLDELIKNQKETNRILQQNANRAANPFPVMRAGGNPPAAPAPAPAPPPRPMVAPKRI